MTLEELKAMAENLRYKDDEVYEPLPEEVVPTLMSEDKRKKDVSEGLKNGTNDNEEPEPIEEPPEEVIEETPEELEEQRISEILENVEKRVWPQGDVPDKESDEYLTGVYIYLLNNTFNAYKMCLSEEDIQRAQEVIEDNCDILGGKKGRITSWFGDRTGTVDHIPGATNDHRGIDINSSDGEDDEGWALNSAWYGTVEFVSKTADAARGYYIDIKLDHERYGEGIVIRMQHLNSVPTLSEGTALVPGQVFGAIGKSGLKGMNAHLHLEILIDGVAVNPLDYPELFRI